MLPRAAYTDPAVFEWERRNFLGGGWMCVARGAQLPAPGAQLAVDIGSGGVLLTRAGDGMVHAFANTCRHRGHELLPCGASATGKAIVCPYHNWAYELAGDAARRAGIPRRAGLRPRRVRPAAQVPVAEWHGWCSSTLRRRRPAVRGPLGALGAIVAPYGRSGWSRRGTHNYELAANWKIAHRELPRVLPLPADPPGAVPGQPADAAATTTTARRAWVGGWMDLRDGAADDVAGRAQRTACRCPALAEPSCGRCCTSALFPNLLLSLHPDYVMTHRLMPLAADRTLDRVPVAVRAGGGRAARLRPGLRGRLLGPDQPAGLGRVRVGAARADLAARRARAAGTGRGRGYAFVTMVARGYLGQRVTELLEPAAR